MRFPEKKPKFPIIEVHDQADQDASSTNNSSSSHSVFEIASEIGCAAGSQLLKKFTLGLAKNLLKNVCGAPGKAKGAKNIDGGKKDDKGSKTSTGDKGNVTAKNPLPNLNNATIEPKKLTDYALNPNHPVGGDKAKVFESALGYNKSNADDLLKQVKEKLPQSEAVDKGIDQWGRKYQVDMDITGPNGNTVNVRTGWIKEIGSESPRLTSIYVKE